MGHRSSQDNRTKSRRNHLPSDNGAASDGNCGSESIDLLTNLLCQLAGGRQDQGVERRRTLEERLQDGEYEGGRCRRRVSEDAEIRGDGGCRTLAGAGLC